MTEGIGLNEPWIYNNGMNAATCSGTQDHTTRQSSHNSFQYNSPNSSDKRHRPTCYRYGEQGHIKRDCMERVYCTNCRSANHDIKACRKQHNNTPSPLNKHIPTGYHPTATPPPLIGATSTGGQPTQQSNTTNNGHSYQKSTNNNISIPRSNGSACRHCPVLDRTGWIKSSSTSRKYRTQTRISCTSSNLIYLIQCQLCNMHSLFQPDFR